jgi:ABC-2 type transport system ATP-binding protein
VTAPGLVAPGGGPVSPAIEVAGLGKSYGGRAVVRDVSFRVEPGEVFALLGPNGAGKTTTVEIVEGYRRPDAGTVTVLGVDPSKSGREDRARVGLMLQGGGGIDPRMTGREVVRLYGRFHADPREADDLLELVGLSPTTAGTRYRRLSGGEKQRVGLALALVGRPDVAILDEPTAGMDVEARAATLDVLRRLREDGVTILLTSHDLADVERIADRIAILDRGRLVALGSPDELTAGAAAVLRFRVGSSIAEPDLRDLAGRLGGGSTVGSDGGPGRYRVDGIAPAPVVVAALTAWCAERGLLVLELRAGAASLEERYLELVGAVGDEEVA